MYENTGTLSPLDEDIKKILASVANIIHQIDTEHVCVGISILVRHNPITNQPINTTVTAPDRPIPPWTLHALDFVTTIASPLQIPRTQQVPARQRCFESLSFDAEPFTDRVLVVSSTNISQIEVEDEYSDGMLQ